MSQARTLAPQAWPVRRAKSKGREQGRGLDGVLEEGLRPRVARQKPGSLCVCVSGGGTRCEGKWELCERMECGVWCFSFYGGNF